ncbi:MAG: T9SS type A sorting domain-containing protein [Flavobacteriales bacterium]|nr:T9SS type A sorting domain-containing protein [Flavobacteriales bacterium]
MQKLVAIVCLLCMWAFQTAAQSDTIRLMHYNLLNYRNSTAQCTNSTNNADKKDGYLETIVAHAKPDILTVNEMGANWLNPNKILTNALNTNGVTHFEQAEFTNNSFSSLTNMLFYNKQKLVLHNQEIISKNLSGANLVRVVDAYTLYVNRPIDLAKGDTVFMTVFVAHLKAGSTSADQTERAEMTEAAMDYLKNNHFDHSYFFTGDFNIQSSSEQCYQNLTNHSVADIRFYDPKDAPGGWNNNSNYANLHTQSTHNSDTRGGCFSSGGMDDRFDFVLIGKEVKNNTYRIKYINGSYTALGQDSRRFNGDVLNPTNNSVPAEVATALYEMSDHLPVFLDLEVQKGDVGIAQHKKDEVSISIVAEGNWEISTTSNQKIKTVNLINAMGQTILDNANTAVENGFLINTQNLSKSVYFVQIILESGEVYTKKVFKGN